MRYNCRGKNVQPSAVKLPIKGSVIKYKNLKDSEGSELTVIIDTESSLLNALEYTKKQKQDLTHDSDEETSNEFREFFSIEKDSREDNVTHIHTSQSLGMLFLDYENKPIEYQQYIQDDIGGTFPEIICKSIDQVMKGVSSKLYKDHHLTPEDEKKIQS